MKFKVEQVKGTFVFRGPVRQRICDTDFDRLLRKITANYNCASQQTKLELHKAFDACAIKNKTVLK